MQKVKVDVENWLHAQSYNLPRREEQCQKEIEQVIAEHLNGLLKLGKQIPESMLQRLWPCLCTAAGIEFFDMPSADAIHSLWPFVAAGVRHSRLLKHSDNASHGSDNSGACEAS